jgi:2-polyprenyl-3-methyl-5-hydroxy-6-metoxy-1,4-benzoquinol methylase
MSMDWKKFWQEYPQRDDNLNEYQQVGKTIGGKPITEEQTKLILSDIIEKLEIKPTDKVLDLCCGNGLLTKELSKHVDQIVGFDFSVPLIETAKMNSEGSDNLSYKVQDVKELGTITDEYKGYFDKVLCYEALAFFDEKDVGNILNSLSKMTKPNSKIFFASVLDREKKHKFFSTPKSKWLQFKMLVTGKDIGLGKWWLYEKLSRVGDGCGYIVKKFNQSNSLHTSHYRSDYLINRK